MPLYEYRCTECEATLEAIQTFSATPLEKCPECGRSSLKKLLSAPAFQFKGSGWYVNDYARKGNGKKSDGDAANGKPAASEAASDQGGKSSDSTSATSAKSESSSPGATP